MAYCDQEYGRPSGGLGCSFGYAQDKLALRLTVQVRLGSNTLRLPGTRRKRLRCAWHPHLHDLATAIHETSGLDVYAKPKIEDSQKMESFF
jgi:hypothetical protein